MTLAQVTRSAVLAAVAEFDRLGRADFLQSTGFGKARVYYLEVDGRLYDSKAIMGYAHGVATGERLRPEDFSGGDRTVADRLRTLGFAVLKRQQPGWAQDDTEEVGAIPDPDLGGIAAPEGAISQRRHLRRERDPKIRAAKIADAKRRGLTIACEVCGFDFAMTYGVRGRDYIECHHRTPLHISGPTRTSLADLALLCSNCHRMIHRQVPWLTVEDLKALVSEA